MISSYLDLGFMNKLDLQLDKSLLSLRSYSGPQVQTGLEQKFVIRLTERVLKQRLNGLGNFHDDY